MTQMHILSASVVEIGRGRVGPLFALSQFVDNTEDVPMAPMLSRVIPALLLCLSILAYGDGANDGRRPTGSTSSSASSRIATRLSGKSPIAVIMASMNGPWQMTLKKATVKRAEELGYDTVTFDSENELAKEAAHFERAIAAKCSAIVLYATDAEGSVKNVRRAKEAGIPVFCLVRRINAKDVAVSQVVSDEFAAGQMIGRYFVQTVQKGQYVELVGLVGDHKIVRLDGFHSVVDRETNLKLLAQQPADFDRAKAAERIGQMLDQGLNFSAVFCENGEMVIGAWQALKAAGKDEQVKLFGFDCPDEVLEMIATGKIAAMIDQNPEKLAATVIEIAHKYINDPETAIAPVILVHADLLTKASAEKRRNATRPAQR
jgi:ABC-type sugar transport system substrate-binding protein